MLSACSNSGDDPVLVALRARMDAKVDSLETVITALRDTPERRLLDARALEAAGKTDSAAVSYAALAEKYPEASRGGRGADGRHADRGGAG